MTTITYAPPAAWRTVHYEVEEARKINADSSADVTQRSEATASTASRTLAAVTRTQHPTTAEGPPMIPTDLLAKGAASPNAHTRRLTAAIAKQIDTLADHLQHDEEIAVELAALDARRAELLSRRSKPTSARAAKIRAWALEQGIDVGPRGRLSAEVVALYEQAQGQR